MPRKKRITPKFPKQIKHAPSVTLRPLTRWVYLEATPGGCIDKTWRDKQAEHFDALRGQRTARRMWFAIGALAVALCVLWGVKLCA